MNTIYLSSLLNSENDDDDDVIIGLVITIIICDADYCDRRYRNAVCHTRAPGLSRWTE